MPLLRHWRVRPLVGASPVVMAALVRAACTRAGRAWDSLVFSSVATTAQEWQPCEQGLLGCQARSGAGSPGVPRQETWDPTPAFGGRPGLWMGWAAYRCLGRGPKKRSPRSGWELCRSNCVLYRLYQEPHRWRAGCLSLPAFAGPVAPRWLSPCCVELGDAWSLPLIRDSAEAGRSLQTKAKQQEEKKVE